METPAPADGVCKEPACGGAEGISNRPNDVENALPCSSNAKGHCVRYDDARESFDDCWSEMELKS